MCCIEYPLYSVYFIFANLFIFRFLIFGKMTISQNTEKNIYIKEKEKTISFSKKTSLVFMSLFKNTFSEHILSILNESVKMEKCQAGVLAPKLNI